VAVFALTLQLAGLTAVIAGGFLLAVPAGIIALGLVTLYVGLAAEHGGR
jgi:hypothetical protein